jgi:hypothetical protein
MSTLPFSRTITEGTTYISPTDYTLAIDTTNGIATLVLPEISNVYKTFKNALGNPITIFGFRFIDIGNNASVNKIVFQTIGNDKINGVQQIEITNDGESGMILVSAGNNYILLNDNILNSINVNSLKTKLLFSVDYNFLNSLPAVSYHQELYTNVIPINSVILSGIYNLIEPFVSSSGHALFISAANFGNEPNNKFNHKLKSNDILGKYYTQLDTKVKINMNFTSCLGIYEFINSLGAPANNPQNWTNGRADVYILYATVNL